MHEENSEARLPGLRPAEDDLALVDRVLAGERPAFDDLVRRHQRRVYRTSLAIAGSTQDAEEAMQETFLKAYQHLSEFRRESLFTTWLTRIAVNEALRIQRRRRFFNSPAAPENPVAFPMPERSGEWYEDPEKRYARREIREFVEVAIRALPLSYRAVFVLRDVEGLTTEEAAEILSLTIPGCKTRLLRARLMVREALAGHFERPPTLKSRLRRTGMMLKSAISSHLASADHTKGNK